MPDVIKKVGRPRKKTRGRPKKDVAQNNGTPQKGKVGRPKGSVDMVTAHNTRNNSGEYPGMNGGMISKLPIEYNVPIPAGTRRSITEILDLDNMQPGGSTPVQIGILSMASALTGARNWASKQLEAGNVHELPKFTAREERVGGKPGFRIWRVK